MLNGFGAAGKQRGQAMLQRSRRLCAGHVVHSRLVMSLDCCVAALPLPVLQLIFPHVIEQEGSSVGLCRVSAVCKTWSKAVLSDPNWCGRLLLLCTSLAGVLVTLSTLQAAYQHPQHPG